jgi:hypothetical protein
MKSIIIRIGRRGHLRNQLWGQTMKYTRHAKLVHRHLREDRQYICAASHRSDFIRYKYYQVLYFQFLTICKIYLDKYFWFVLLLAHRFFFALIQLRIGINSDYLAAAHSPHSGVHPSRIHYVNCVIFIDHDVSVARPASAMTPSHSI